MSDYAGLLEEKKKPPSLGTLRHFLALAAGKFSQFLERHRWGLVVVAVGLASRIFVAGSESYWNDEILSVYMYGSRHGSLGEALSKLANNSVHPPLYQAVLWFWMQLFGTSEVATRTLSSIFVGLGTFFFYLLLVPTFSRLTASLAALAFTLSFSAMTYGLEARSYAFTLFLATSSSFLLFQILLNRARRRGWKLWSPWLAVFLVNSGLLLTHYYNVFFIIGQALFVVSLVWHHRSSIGNLLKLMSFSVLAPALFFSLLWLPTLLRQYSSRFSKYGNEGLPSRNPFEVFKGSLVGVNFSSGLLATVVLLAVAVAVVAVFHPRLSRFAGVSRASNGRLSLLHLLSWLFFPIIVAWGVFAVLGVERYNSRYFLFSLPPLFALFTIGLVTAVSLVFAKLRVNEPLRFFLSGSIVLLLVLPGGYEGATAKKQDWRGTVSDVIAVVEGDPNSRYLIVEMSFSSFPRSTYYFEYLDSQISPYRGWRSSQVLSGDFSVIEATLEELVVDEYDRLIVLFAAVPASRYSDAISHLKGTTDLIHTQLDQTGRGYLVFAPFS